MTERWLEPLGLVTGPAAFHAVRSGAGLPLLGGPAAFLLVRRIAAGQDQGVGPVAGLGSEWDTALDRLTRPLPPFAGLGRTEGVPLVMGIVNTTPDSFSGDGLGRNAAAAIAHGHALLAAGADMLDVGGESTRPGALPVTPEEEQRRILPVVRELAKATTVSVDTRNASTMAAVLEAGAEVVNDISALRHDGNALRVVQQAQAPLVLMHMLGMDPRSMQQNPHYADVALDVARFLRDRVETLERLGIPRGRIAVDPGIGFGKTVAHNLALLERLPLLAGLGCTILVGVSRKGFIGRLTDTPEPGQRVAGSVAAALAATLRGAGILRVHDVAETVQALKVWAACEAGALPE